ncbi:MAG: bifunctional (p)ppGpp synthetase/guanosine-3',5'-bis(diphosphate) 3'-pyrophosphohydrolase [candidate division Zixibacteria bacterium]|nr:bifunctional (p)ppGpp synthetase/guanosine-3',5'-bis(diphosphate) 3'-pyrophosphohydrolase [candidate division Zixibacteria bacterium]
MTTSAPTLESPPPKTRDKALQVLMEQCAITHPDMDLDLVESAYAFGNRYHGEQKRQSGEPYMVHCAEVALILIGWHMDSATIAAGLLHDVLEDVEALTPEHLVQAFGEEITTLVNGVTKIPKIDIPEREERQAESFRKMLLKIAEDVRVVIIKLADRLHNMRTLSYLDTATQRRIALETRDIYAPLAHRLGMAQVKSELEDLSFKYLDPKAYRDISGRVAQNREKREQLIEEIKKTVAETLKKADIHATVKGRAKHLYSIHTKMERRERSFEEIYDLLALRIVVDTPHDCYHALGVIHNLYNPMFGRFKDYIAKPKMNMYQSLHTTVVAAHGEIVEIQIRTREMDRVAEVGIAAHWLYKENRSTPTEADKRMEWLQQWIAFQMDLTDNREFMEYLSMGLYEDDIFVFTPKGEVKELPQGATALDFAFAIHTDVGFHCTAAKVNGRIVPLATPLKTGETVQIVTNPHQTPSLHWLDIVKTPRAKSKINAWFKKATYDQSVALGTDLVERELKRLRIRKKPGEEMEEIAKAYGQVDAGHLYAAIGRGDFFAAQVVQRLSAETPAPQKEASLLAKFVDRVRRSNEEVKLRGADNLLVRFAQCCQPVPGDPIVGCITRGRGVTIHHKDCVNVMEDLERRLYVDWDTGEKQSFLVGLKVLAHDRTGLLNEISKAITDSGLNITSATMTTGGRQAYGWFTIEVRHADDISRVFERINRIRGVQSVERQSGASVEEVRNFFDHADQR